MTNIRKSIEVNVPVHTAYDLWTHFEDFPRFLQGVQEVRRLDESHLHWSMLVRGQRRDWDATIVDQVPDERIAWRSEDGVLSAATLAFQPIDESTTRLDVQLEYEPVDIVERLGDRLGLISRRIERDLQRFKELAESEGEEPAGWRRTIAQRLPAKRRALALAGVTVAMVAMAAGVLLVLRRRRRKRPIEGRLWQAEALQGRLSQMKGRMLKQIRQRRKASGPLAWLKSRRF